MTACQIVEIAKLESSRLPGGDGKPEIKSLIFEMLNRFAGDLTLKEHPLVVIKPNWVKENDERHPGPNAWEHVVTDPTVIRSAAAWVGERFRGARIIICDAPQTDSSFSKLKEYCRLDEMVKELKAIYPEIDISILDLRPEEWCAVDGVTVSKTNLPGDPLGSTKVELNEGSEFVGFHGEGRLYGASFDMEETNTHHLKNRHEYMLCRTPMEADLFINLPKLKTHKKVGLTCALKNLVGINANKNWLPHHTEGTPEQGGDQFPLRTTKAVLEHTLMGKAKQLISRNMKLAPWLIPLKRMARLYFGDTQQVVRSGNWHGNDTCWRMVLDLNKCLFFYDGDGNQRTKPLQYLTIVDGIIAGEGNGPMAPDRVEAGILMAGTHPVAVDCVAAKLMGFDWRKIRMLKGAFEMRDPSFVDFRPEEIMVKSNVEAWNGPMEEMTDTFHFKPHFGWVGAIEAQSKGHA